MKKNWALLPLMMLLAAALLPAQGKMQVKIDNYEITVPTGWMAQRTDSDALFILYSPVEEDDTFRENVNLVEEQLLLKTTPENYLKAARTNLTAAFGEFDILEQGKDYHIIRLETGDQELQLMQCARIKGKTAIVITCTASPESFERYQPVFKEIVGSFKYK